MKVTVNILLANEIVKVSSNSVVTIRNTWPVPFPGSVLIVATAAGVKGLVTGVIRFSRDSIDNGLLRCGLTVAVCLVFLNQLRKPSLLRKDILRSPDHSLGCQDFVPYEIPNLSLDSPCLND